MVDQVNPTGSLVTGLVATVAQPASSRPATSKPSAATSGARPADRPAGPESAGPAAHDSALSQISTLLQQNATSLKVQVDKGTGHTVYKIVDEKSGRLVLQIPSDEVLALARNLRAMDPTLGASGALVDKQG